MGTLQMVTGAVVMAGIASFVIGTAMPMVAGIAAVLAGGLGADATHAWGETQACPGIGGHHVSITA